MTVQDSPSPDRRQFITAVVAAAAGSLATGSSIAFLNRSGRQAASRISPPAAVLAENSPSLGLPAAANQPDLLARLVAAQTENTRLQAELDAALRRLDIAESSGASTDDEIELLRGELTSSQGRFGLLAGLTALYEQLEDVDIGQTVSEGINDVAGYFASLALSLPELAEGLDSGEAALDLFEADLPALAAGRVWFGQQLARLALGWELVENLLRDTLEGVEPALVMIQTWFDKLLGWVPFEWGERARQIMNAVFGLLEETPRTIEGGQRDVMVSLDKWFKPEGGEVDPAVRTRLFNPVREKTIGSARRTVEQVKSAQKSFQHDLVARTATVVADRQEIRRQITRYRQENGL